MNQKENIQDEINYLESGKQEFNELQDFVTNFATGYNAGTPETPEYCIKMLGVIMRTKRIIDEYQQHLESDLRELDNN
jgi:hypothetical protein